MLQVRRINESACSHGDICTYKLIRFSSFRCFIRRDSDVEPILNLIRAAARMKKRYQFVRTRNARRAAEGRKGKAIDRQWQIAGLRLSVISLQIGNERLLVLRNNSSAGANGGWEWGEGGGKEETRYEN